MRAIMGRVVTVLVGVVIAALGPAAAGASAEVLVSQPPGPSGIGVSSDERPEGSKAYDDFDIPAHGHWHLEAVRVYGTATLEHPRTFKVLIYPGFGGPLSVNASNNPIFSERVTVAGGPNYLIPIEGAPVLSESETGQWLISVQAQSEGAEDDWYWLTGPDTTGDAPAYHFGREEAPGAEPGLAFELLGTATQTVKAQVSGTGTLVSTPPGISCPGTCAAEFRRGTTLTFSASTPNTATKFTEWGFRKSAVVGLVPDQIPSPCGGTGGCSFTLDGDTNVGAVFEANNELDVLRVVRDRRAGKGQLLVWIPGPGALGLFSEGLRSYSPGTMPAGVDRIPLVPTKKVATVLRKKGHATVSAEVTFRPFMGDVPTTVVMQVTLVRKRADRPVHRPAHPVH